MRDLFDALEIRGLIAGGCYVEELEREPTPAKSCDGLSSYWIIRDLDGRRVGRIHYLDCEGRERLWFPSQLLVGTVSIFRSGHQRRPI